MKIIQLSDIHLLSSKNALIKGRCPNDNLKNALNEAKNYNPDLILITGDICEDETRSGYLQFREELKCISKSAKIALLPGNHDNPLLMNKILSSCAIIAPAEIFCNGVRLIILSSHLSGKIEGIIDQKQINWLKERLNDLSLKGYPLLIALHHPPIKIGDPFLHRKIGNIFNTQSGH